MTMPPPSGKRVVADALAGRAVPRCPVGPLAVHYCARRCGVSVREYTTDPCVLADCVLRYYEAFRPDAVWISADTWVTAEAMGARVAFPGDDQPLGGRGEPLVRGPADVDRISPADPNSQGRMPLLLEALRLVHQAIGEETFVVACFDQFPFSRATSLMGIDRALTAMIDDPPFLEALMERCLEYAAAYARALAEAGAAMLSGGDSPAGLIGPGRYRSVALPFARRLVAELKTATALPVSMHICGDATGLLPDMAATGADVLELDHQVDLRRAGTVLGPEVGIWGNLDPVDLLSRGSPDDVRRAVREALSAVAEKGHRRFVLSSGCTLAMETPAENLHALFDEPRPFASRPAEETVE